MNFFQTTKMEHRESLNTEVTAYQPDIIGLQEASKILGVHRNTIYKLIQEKSIPAFRLSRGGRWKFRRGELEQWIQDKEATSQV